MILIALIVILIVIFVLTSVKIVPQSRGYVVERLGKYKSTLYGGLNIIIPFIDRVVNNVDLREQVNSFPPQSVITLDNVVVSIDSVVYYTVTDPKSVTYEIANYIQAIEQLTTTTLRNLIGSMDLEETLTSRDQINGQLRGVLDEATGNWGIRVNRVELKSIDPPPSIQQAMEKQMRAERDKRAVILESEGIKQSEILKAEGEKQSEILRAQGEAQAIITKANAESQAITTVFNSIHAGNPNAELLAYQYLRTLPEIANGNSSTMWVIPAEVTAALNNITQGFFKGTPRG